MWGATTGLASWLLKNNSLKDILMSKINTAVNYLDKLKYFYLTEQIRKAGFDPRPWDIVFLRNVLFYFPDEVRRDILRRIHATLAHDGYLILGNTESIYGQDDLFSRTGGSVCCLQPK